MLKIYDVIIEVVAELKPVMLTIERRDADLARHVRRLYVCGAEDQDVGGSGCVRWYRW